ncbi:MAG: hypothetical protein U1F26_01430 [Lysobacterales bacterium]
MHNIDIRIRSLAQLFDSLDPSPFHEKALDRDAEAYLLDSAAEFPASAALRVLIHGPAELAGHLEEIRRGLHAHFRLAHTLAVRRHQRRLRVGRLGMLLGLLVLVIALLLRAWVADWRGPLGEALAEGLLILAWVALWRPAETALFDRWEHREQLKLLDQLATVPVEFREYEEAPAGAAAS